MSECIRVNICHTVGDRRTGMKLEMSSKMSENCDSIWVFGYGSLTWKPGITYTSKRYGFIKGFKRRFWQGNTTHRGTPEQPGRVATLVEDNTSVLWGVAYELRGPAQIQAGMASLTTRETRLGGYSTLNLDFHPRGCDHRTLTVLVYTATPDCDLYMGPPKSIDQMALQIVTSHGSAGPNSDYVTKLADFTRKYIPEENDEHLFMLDQKIRSLLARRTHPRKRKNSYITTNQSVDSSIGGEAHVMDITKPICIEQSYEASSIEPLQTSLLKVKLVTRQN